MKEKRKKGKWMECCKKRVKGEAYKERKERRQKRSYEGHRSYELVESRTSASSAPTTDN